MTEQTGRDTTTDTDDQDAEPASAPSGAADESTAAEQEDQDAGPASAPPEG